MSNDQIYVYFLRQTFGMQGMRTISFQYILRNDCLVFSSPEPKAHGELIVYQSIRRLCFNIFKHEYLHNQWADCNQILFEASLGRGKGCNMFLARSDWNSSFHGSG